jgi:DNA helicase-2/ATP-dependent DNA helicase PcrA
VGTVLATTGSGDKSQALIDFGHEIGPKRLLLRYAPIEKL